MAQQWSEKVNDNIVDRNKIIRLYAQRLERGEDIWTGKPLSEVMEEDEEDCELTKKDMKVLENLSKKIEAIEQKPVEISIVEKKAVESNGKLTKWHCKKCHNKFDRSIVGKQRILFFKTKLCRRCRSERGGPGFGQAGGLK